MVCLSDFMTYRDRAEGRLVEVLPKQALEMRQPINAVYYRNTALSARIATFVSYLSECGDANAGRSSCAVGWIGGALR